LVIATAPYVLPRIRNLDTVYDSFLLSLEIGITEEVIYRLFFLSCILYTVKYLHRRWRPEARLPLSVTPISVALMASSLIFTFAHRSPFSFSAAFLGGLVLGLVFISKGVETAITAHVAADFLFFTVSYIYKS
jgi:membrane protease YdiL (CAAX protease family)